MAVGTQPRRRRGAINRCLSSPRIARNRALARRLIPGLAGLVRTIGIALALMAWWPASGALAMPRMTVHGDRLYAGAKLWRAWGMNWGVANHVPVIAYFDHPTAANLSVLRAELGTARSMGANSMRIYLQLGQVMATATRPRTQTLAALGQLLALAQHDRIYLDITGDLVWRPSRSPAWYARLSRRARWQVQARFWKAVAHTAADSPAVLCYELTSEPTISPTAGYYYGQIGPWWFVQSVATARGRRADQLARAWTKLLANAVRSQDDRPVTIGLLPVTNGPFAPANIAGLLDMLVVHEYPNTGQAPGGISLIRSFAASHKPVLLGETFMLNDDAPTQQTFLTGAAPYLSGALEFFDGQDPRTMQPHTIYNDLYQQSLNQFTSLRPLILDG